MMMEDSILAMDPDMDEYPQPILSQKVSVLKCVKKRFLD
jgi:hypothetical protein